jgi:tripeptidyl-peptidase I
MHMCETGPSSGLSDPKSPNYGKHLTREEVDQVVAPNAEAIATIVDWIASETGVRHDEIAVVGSGDFLRVNLPVSKAS